MLNLDLTCFVISCWDFGDRDFGEKNYTFVVIIMRASDVYGRNISGGGDKFCPIILLLETDIVILLNVSFWYKCTHAHPF